MNNIVYNLDNDITESYKLKEPRQTYEQIMSEFFAELILPYTVDNDDDDIEVELF